MPSLPVTEPSPQFLQAAQLVLTKRRDVVATFLQWGMDITKERAVELLRELEVAGIIDSPNAMGAHNALVSNEQELEFVLANPGASLPTAPKSVSELPDSSEVKSWFGSRPASEELSAKPGEGNLFEGEASDGNPRNAMDFHVPAVRDDLFAEAVMVVVASQQASASFLRQRLRVGDPRARRILDQLTAAGIVAGGSGGGGRPVIMPIAALDEFLGRLQLDSSDADELDSFARAEAAINALEFFDEPDSASAPELQVSAPRQQPAASVVSSPPHSIVPPPAQASADAAPAPTSNANTLGGCLILLVGAALVLGLLWGGYRAVSSLFSSSSATTASESVASTVSDSLAAESTPSPIEQVMAAESGDTIARSPREADVDSLSSVETVSPEASDSARSNSSSPAPRSSSPQPTSAAAPAEAPAATPPPVNAPASLSPTVPAASEPGDLPVTGKIREALADFYADLQEAPFNVTAHLAPQVKRFNTLANPSADDIVAYLQEAHFANYRDAVLQVAPHSLTVSSPAADGSRQLSYIEERRAYVVPAGRYYRSRTSIHAFIDTDYHLTFYKADRLLENGAE